MAPAASGCAVCLPVAARRRRRLRRLYEWPQTLLFCSSAAIGNRGAAELLAVDSAVLLATLIGKNMCYCRCCCCCCCCLGCCCCCFVCWCWDVPPIGCCAATEGIGAAVFTPMPPLEEPTLECTQRSATLRRLLSFLLRLDETVPPQPTAQLRETFDGRVQ